MTFKLVYRVSREMVAPIETITSVYATNVNSRPWSVPAGMDLLGFFRSPLMLAPAKIPAVAGNRMPKRPCQFSLSNPIS